jgi:hypothetical protein
MSILTTRGTDLQTYLSDPRSTPQVVANLAIPARFVVRPQLLKRVQWPPQVGRHWWSLCRVWLLVCVAVVGWWYLR